MHIPIRTFSATVHSVRLSYKLSLIVHKCMRAISDLHALHRRMGWALLLLLLRSTQGSLCDSLRTLASYVRLHTVSTTRYTVGLLLAEEYYHRKDIR